MTLWLQFLHTRFKSDNLCLQFLTQIKSSNEKKINFGTSILTVHINVIIVSVYFFVRYTKMSMTLMCTDKRPYF